MVMKNFQNIQYDTFPLQWHLTVKCDQHCEFCYMYDSPTYESEKKNELSVKECKKIIDKYKDFTDEWSMKPRISFTGGDPLLKEGFFKILSYCKEKNIPTAILGNPYHLDRETISELENNNLRRYQLSIDGLKEIHDSFRKEGSFEETLRGLRLLKKSRILSAVMFTISKKNKDEIFDVIDLAVKEGVNIFDFARFVPAGTGEDKGEDVLEPEEYRKILYKILEKYLKLKRNGVKTTFGRKEPLWYLLYKDLGLLRPYKDTSKNYTGCSLGRHLAILADGTIQSCRRVGDEVGKMPEDGFEEILLNSKDYQRNINVENYKKCKDCEISPFCRGCRAVSKGFDGKIFTEDPSCWR